MSDTILDVAEASCVLLPQVALPAPQTAHPVVSPDTSASLGGPVEIWTDGGCRPNPGPGGWAAILRGAKGEERVVSGTETSTTNNRMELTAAIGALDALMRPCRVTVHADSEYLVLGMTVWLPRWQAARWRTSKGKTVENRDLWERLANAAAPHEVDWKWTRGHAGDPMNERVDRLATAAREKEVRR